MERMEEHDDEPLQPVVSNVRFKSLLNSIEQMYNLEVSELSNEVQKLRDQLIDFNSSMAPLVSAEQPLESAEGNVASDVCVNGNGASDAFPSCSSQCWIPSDANPKRSSSFLSQTVPFDAITEDPAELLESNMISLSSDATEGAVSRASKNSQYSAGGDSMSEATEQFTRKSTLGIDDMKKEVARATQSATVRRPTVVRHILDEDSDLTADGIERYSLRHKLRLLINCFAFQIFFAVATLANSIFLGIRMDYNMMHPQNTDPLLIQLCEYSFTALFTVELVLRVYAEGLRVFISIRQMHWYYLDLFLVVTSWFEAVLEIVDATSTRKINISNARTLRVLRIVRLVKIAKVARVVRFVRALRTLVLSVMHTLKSVLWSFALLLMIIYMFALIFAQAVHDHIVSGTSPSSTSSALGLYWGTLPSAMFTLYKSITGGISWHEVVLPLADVGDLLVALFVLFISFTVFAVLNVITGVFCEAAIESARQDYEMMIHQHLAEKEKFTTSVCELFGVEIGGGQDVVLTYQEFEAVLTHPNTKAYLAAIQLDIEDAWELFKLLDTDESALIDVQEFVNGCLRLKGLAKAIDIAKLDYEHKIRSKRLVKHMHSVEKMLRGIARSLQLSEDEPRTFISDRSHISDRSCKVGIITPPGGTPSNSATSHGYQVNITDVGARRAGALHARRTVPDWIAVADEGSHFAVDPKRTDQQIGDVAVGHDQLFQIAGMRSL